MAAPTFILDTRTSSPSTITWMPPQREAARKEVAAAARDQYNWMYVSEVSLLGAREFGARTAAAAVAQQPKLMIFDIQLRPPPPPSALATASDADQSSIALSQRRRRRSLPASRRKEALVTRGKGK